jgi:hypothetical protein
VIDVIPALGSHRKNQTQSIPDWGMESSGRAKFGGEVTRFTRPERNPSGPDGSTKACGSGHERLPAVGNFRIILTIGGTKVKRYPPPKTPSLPRFCNFPLRMGGGICLPSDLDFSVFPSAAQRLCVSWFLVFLLLFLFVCLVCFVVKMPGFVFVFFVCTGFLRFYGRLRTGPCFGHFSITYPLTPPPLPRWA